MLALLRQDGPFERRNSRLFVLFTTFYNARAYYPVLAILFKDLGLSLDQFVMLNVVWAASILLCEVPSGALADTLGRKRLLVFASAVMVVELGVLLAAPKGGGAWLFGFCVLNRMLSGVSEAAVSGADEAITYDDLPEDERESAWDQVLVTAMRWRSVGFLISMTLGGLLYDPTWWNRMVPDVLELSRDVAHRLPVAVVFMQGLVCLLIALRFEEKRPPKKDQHPIEQCIYAFKITMRTAKKAVTTRSIAMVLLGGLIIDAVTRNMATLGSAYYRLIQFPDWVFGFIGSLIAVGNWFVPVIAAKVNQRLSPVSSLLVGGVVTIGALFMLVPAWKWVGVLPAMMLMMMMGYVGFTISRFLHKVSESNQRATLLSVKGMIFNLSYGTFSLAFSLLLARLEENGGGGFQRALLWQACFFVGLVVLYAVVTRLKKSRLDPVVPE